MSSQAASFDRAERQAFVARQFQDYQKTNPEIPQVIRKIWGLEQAGHDFLAAMWPLFEGLRMVTEFLGQLPVISANSAERAWSELHEAPLDVLNSEDFDYFRYIIEMGFRMMLDASVTLPGIKQRVERIFTMILRMIQIELKLREGGRAAG
jgi:hypothetical protein